MYLHLWKFVPFSTNHCYEYTWPLFLTYKRETRIADLPSNRKSRGGTQSYHSNYSTLWMFHWIGLYLARCPSPPEMPHESPTKVVTIMTIWLSIRHLLQIKISLVFYVLVYIHFTPSFTLFPLTPILYYEFVLWPFSKGPF